MNDEQGRYAYHYAVMAVRPGGEPMTAQDFVRLPGPAVSEEQAIDDVSRRINQFLDSAWAAGCSRAAVTACIYERDGGGLRPVSVTGTIVEPEPAATLTIERPG